MCKFHIFTLYLIFTLGLFWVSWALLFSLLLHITNALRTKVTLKQWKTIQKAYGMKAHTQKWDLNGLIFIYSFFYHSWSITCLAYSVFFFPLCVLCRSTVCHVWFKTIIKSCLSASMFRADNLFFQGLENCSLLNSYFASTCIPLWILYQTLKKYYPQNKDILRPRKLKQ